MVQAGIKKKKGLSKNVDGKREEGNNSFLTEYSTSCAGLPPHLPGLGTRRRVLLDSTPYC